MLSPASPPRMSRQMIPLEIRQCLLDPQGVHTTTPLSPGLSGAKLFRCEGHQTLVLRCWPAGTSAARVREIQTVISPLASACHLIPRYQANIRDGELFATDSLGSIWELATWMPGQPLAYDAPFDLIRTGAGVIAKVHQELRRAGTWQRPAEAINERLNRLNRLRHSLSRCFDINLDGHVHPSVVVPLSTARGLLAVNWPRMSEQIVRTLSPFRDRSLPVQYVLRDIHREHMLFRGGNVSGMIDFDAVRIDTPAVDLARWAGSFSQFRQDPAGIIDCVLAGYFDAPPLPGVSGQPDTPGNIADFGGPDSAAPTSDFRTLILVISESSLWLSLANWVVWLVGESRQFPDFQRVAERLSRIIESIQGHLKR